MMDSLPNNVAVGCTTAYDSATMRLVSLFKARSPKNGINQNSPGSSSGRRTITDLSANNANENASGGKESLVARSTEDCQRTQLRAYSKVRPSLPVSTLRNTTNLFACMHKCVRQLFWIQAEDIPPTMHFSEYSTSELQALKKKW